MFRVSSLTVPSVSPGYSAPTKRPCRLALIYACSVERLKLLIDADAARWAGAFIEHQTRRMLFMASRYASESDFDAKRKRLLEVLPCLTRPMKRRLSRATCGNSGIPQRRPRSPLRVTLSSIAPTSSDRDGLVASRKSMRPRVATSIRWFNVSFSPLVSGS